MLSNIFNVLSSFLLSLILVDFVVRLIRKEGRVIKKYFSYTFLALAITLTIRIGVQNYLHNFLSETAYLSIIPFFVYGNPYLKLLWLIYALLIGYLRVITGVNDLIQVLSAYLFTSIGILVFERVNMREIHRKIVHIGLGSLIGYITFIKPLYGISFMILLLVIGSFLYMIRGNELVSFFLKEYSKDGSGKEAFTFITGILVSSFVGVLLGINPYFVSFYLAWVDGLSAIFGVKSKGKSVKGLFGGIIGGVLSALVTKTNPLFAIIIPFTEYKARRIDDNLIIPISSLLFYILLVYLSNVGLYYFSPHFPF